jgi:hypothetical protein
MAFRLTSDARTTARSRRRTRLAAESLEARALMAADVAPAIAPISMSSEPVVGNVGIDPMVVICVMPEPGFVPEFAPPGVISGPDGGGENVMYTTAMVQRTNVSRVSLPRPASLVAQQRYGQPRIAPVIQQTAAPRRNNEVQVTAAQASRPQQTPGHFARQIAARFGRVGGLVSR